MGRYHQSFANRPDDPHATVYTARVVVDDDASDLEFGQTAVATVHGARPRIPPQFVLLVVEGPDAGQWFAFDDATPMPVLVGQSPSCTLRLSDPLVSRRHLALEIVRDDLWVTDLQSTNGTFASGLRVEAAYLNGGELLRLGSTTIRVDRRPTAIAHELPTAGRFRRVLGVSVAMRRLYPLFERLAGSDVPVLIEGETGTGKEALAESLHEASSRAANPFIVFDCTTVAPNLIESELFGHTAGAFTGAIGSRKGAFELAKNGTLFIDEIGELDLALQPKLLRAIERSEIRPVGGERVIRVNTRVLAATRRNLDQEIQKGRFRDDLYYRLAVGRLELPPLRKREGDIPLLAQHFWKELGGREDALSADVVRRWESSPWPGNIRELRNAVARHLALGDLAGPVDDASQPDAAVSSDFLDGRDGDQSISKAASEDIIDQVIAKGLPLPVARMHVVKAFEERYIRHVLSLHGGNVVQAAKASGIARRYFQILRSGKRR